MVGQCSGPAGDGGRPAGDSAGRAVVLAAEEGAWADRPPPDLQPQFRCLRHGRGAVVRPSRWTKRGAASGGE